MFRSHLRYPRVQYQGIKQVLKPKEHTVRTHWGKDQWSLNLNCAFETQLQRPFVYVMNTYTFPIGLTKLYYLGQLLRPWTTVSRAPYWRIITKGLLISTKQTSQMYVLSNQSWMMRSCPMWSKNWRSVMRTMHGRRNGSRIQVIVAASNLWNRKLIMNYSNHFPFLTGE